MKQAYLLTSNVVSVATNNRIALHTYGMTLLNTGVVQSLNGIYHEGPTRSVTTRKPLQLLNIS